MENKINICFECNSDKNIVKHHVVPRSIGGKKTIYLCQLCHDKVHGIKSSRNISISELSKLGLKIAKLRGVKLGNPRPDNALNLAHIARKRGADSFAGQILPVIEEIRQKANVTSYRGIAEILNVRGLKTANGKQFAAQSVKNILFRI